MKELSKKRFKDTLLIFLMILFTTSAQSIHACGWWGDGEMEKHSDLGEPLHQTLTKKTSKLPGRIGYGIAIPDPGQAIPYLQATGGQQINRISELKSFGFKTVIDLGTSKKTARLHRMETEELGMQYISIPVDGLVPNQDQISLFTQKVVDSSNDFLLVYAPSAELLGTMWAAYRIKLGAPHTFAYNQGRMLGMTSIQEETLRQQLANL